MNIFGCMLVVTALHVSASGGTETTQPDPKALIAQLKERVAVHPKTGGEAEAWDNIVQTIDALTACGEPAIPAIVSALEDEAKHPEDTAAYLARSLAQMPGDKPARALVSLFCKNPPLRGAITGGLLTGRYEGVAPWGRKKQGTMGFRLSQEEMQVFLTAMEGASPHGSRAVGEIMSLCDDNDVTPAVEILTKKLIRQVEDPAVSYANPRRSLYSAPPQVVMLTQYVLGLAAMTDRSLPVLRRERERATTGQTRKWLTIALGYARDREVGPVLEEIVRSEPDPYVKAAAIHAYGWSLGIDSIPLIETLKDDKTVTEYGDVPIRIIGSAAGEMIGRIRSGEIK